VKEKEKDENGLQANVARINSDLFFNNVLGSY
jgi:hypothetical protein